MGHTICQGAPFVGTHRTPRLPRSRRLAAPDATHLAHEMRRLPRKSLVRGRELRTQLGDGRRLLIGLRLGGAQPRPQRDAAVLQPAGLAILLLESG